MELENGEKSIFQEKRDFWSQVLCFSSQVRGKYTVTDRRIMFQSFMGVHDFEIRYKEIASFSKCNVGALIRIMPTGVLVKTKEGKKYRLSVLGRKKYLEVLETHVK